MEYAYQELGIIHRDIKPGNVMVQKDPRFRSGYCFKVTDFGLSGALFPISSLPAWIVPITLLDPLTYGVDGI